MYWLVGDVWTVWYSGWLGLCGQWGILVGWGCVDSVVFWLVGVVPASSHSQKCTIDVSSIDPSIQFMRLTVKEN